MYRSAGPIGPSSFGRVQEDLGYPKKFRLAAWVPRSITKSRDHSGKSNTPLNAEGLWDMPQYRNLRQEHCRRRNCETRRLNVLVCKA